MPVSSEVKRGEGRTGHVCTPPPAYLTLELGCEPGCGEGCGGGGIDCGVCTCWPGDGEDSMVRLLWLTWKWRDLASSMLYTHPAQSTHWSDLSSYTPFFLQDAIHPGTSLTSGCIQHMVSKRVEEGQVGSLAPWRRPMRISGFWAGIAVVMTCFSSICV